MIHSCVLVLDTNTELAPFLGVHRGTLHPLWEIDGAILLLISMLSQLILNKKTLNRTIASTLGNRWGDTSFDINAFTAHSKQQDIGYGDIFLHLNAFAGHSKQWAGFFRPVRLFNMGRFSTNCIFVCYRISLKNPNLV